MNQLHWKNKKRAVNKSPPLDTNITLIAKTINIQESEIWREVDDSVLGEGNKLFPNKYYASDMGRHVFFDNKNKPKLRKIAEDKEGYIRVSFRDENKKEYKKMAHRATMFTFVGPPDDLACTQVDHKNRNRQNNVLSNLTWVTPSENLRNRGPFKRNPDRPVYTPPSNWSGLEFYDHPVIPDLACSECGMLKFKEIPVACHNNNNGYWICTIPTVGSRRVHRVAWECFNNRELRNKGETLNGKIVESKEMVDHKNGDKGDNHKQNLRVTDASGNARNRTVGPNNKSGILGVDLYRKGFRARITNPNSKTSVCKCSKNKDEVVQWRKQQEIEYEYTSR